MTLRPCLLALAAACALASLAAPAGAAHRRDLQKEQHSLQGRVDSLRKDISAKQARAEETQGALRASEKAISDSNRALLKLKDDKRGVENELSDLKREASLVDVKLDDAEETASLISQSQFVNARRGPWLTMLEGGSPGETARLTAILDYMADEQSNIIERLNNRQKNLEEVTRRAAAKRKELARIEAEEQSNKRQLERDQRSRQRALESLRRDIRSKQERLEQLQKDEQQLGRLIAELDLRSKREAAERERRLEAERRQAAARQQAGARPKADDRPKASPAPKGDFAAQKGKLLMPARGAVVSRFGQHREGAASSLVWRGLLIRARQGQPVHACAAGTVVFSDWMRGFGNLIIIDHGSDYLSVYANNEALLKSVGAPVRRGDAIASVGSSGGEDTPGLYFELRHKGKPFDPSRWIAR